MFQLCIVWYSELVLPCSRKDLSLIPVFMWGYCILICVTLSHMLKLCKLGRIIMMKSYLATIKNKAQWLENWILISCICKLTFLKRPVNQPRKPRLLQGGQSIVISKHPTFTANVTVAVDFLVISGEVREDFNIIMQMNSDDVQGQ